MQHLELRRRDGICSTKESSVDRTRNPKASGQSRKSGYLEETDACGFAGGPKSATRAGRPPSEVIGRHEVRGGAHETARAA
jgi:hypothetical protein